MRLVDFLYQGASAHPPAAPCLTTAGQARSYAEVQRLSWSVGRALARSGIEPGDKVAVLSGNDPVACASLFGTSRAGAIWCPVNPRNEAAENRELLSLLDCSCLIFAAAFAPLVERIVAGFARLTALVCLAAPAPAGPGAGGGAGAAAGSRPGPAAAVPFRDWLAGLDGSAGADLPAAIVARRDEDGERERELVMIAGTGG